MASKSFRLNTIARVIALGASLFVLFYLFSQTTLYATATVVALVILYQIYELIRHVERTNFELSRFLRSIRYADFSQTFSSRGRGSSFDALNTAFTEVVEEFQKARAEKEEHFQYLQTVVQHIGVGLLAFTPNGEVALVNTAAKRLLGIDQLINIKSLEPVSASLVRTLFSMRSGQKVLVKTEIHKEPLQLIVSATELKLRGELHTLVSLQNIRSELDEKEVEAWQQLIRVLTHEIMNSITPISSLASTVNEMLTSSHPAEDHPKVPTPDLIRDIRGAVQTIEKRSQGLLHFVDAYRSLTKVPPPKFQIVSVKELFGQVEQLMHQRLAESRIVLSQRLEPSSLELTADPGLIEQVLINLILNAAEALHESPEPLITLSAYIGERGRVTIEVADNGPGITKEVQEKIFVPFFTTKPNGSGIGLSLSRQILRLHGGIILLNSEPGKQTVFTLRF
ncbi:MAG TPA: ATP-binding protein [Bacteroidetes bacterium]|nr:ATP-binding protein [Bacteroidota bacterium]